MPSCFLKNLSLLLNAVYFVAHSTVGAVAHLGAAFGPGSGGIFLDNVVCDGFERRLVDCASNPPATSNCQHLRDAGVACQPIITRKFIGLLFL